MSAPGSRSRSRPPPPSWRPPPLPRDCEVFDVPGYSTSPTPTTASVSTSAKLDSLSAQRDASTSPAPSTRVAQTPTPGATSATPSTRVAQTPTPGATSATPSTRGAQTPTPGATSATPSTRGAQTPGATSQAREIKPEPELKKVSAHPATQDSKETKSDSSANVKKTATKTVDPSLGAGQHQTNVSQPSRISGASEKENKNDTTLNPKPQSFQPTAEKVEGKTFPQVETNKSPLKFKTNQPVQGSTLTTTTTTTTLTTKIDPDSKKAESVTTAKKTLPGPQPALVEAAKGNFVF